MKLFSIFRLFRVYIVIQVKEIMLCEILDINIGTIVYIRV